MFESLFNHVFRSDRPMWWKVAGGAVVAMAVSLAAVIGTIKANKFAPVGGLIAIAVAMGLGAIAGLLLGIGDIVRRRIKAGEHVPFLLRMLFGWGIRSGAIWFVVVLCVSFWLIILVFGYLGV